jgi:MFS family permease
VGQTLAFLLVQPALWGAFLFFAFTSIALSAVQNYTIPMLDDVYGIDKVMAGTTLSAYMLCAAIGMVAGGFLVGATARTERTVAISLILAGGLLVLLAGGIVPPLAAPLLVGLAGFCAGVSSPSRDMLIRRVTPKGATGTVYGLVYSGMDVGSALAPVAFGLMLDIGFRQGPWFGAALSFLVAALMAMWVAKAASAGALRPAQALMNN